jgi:MSHA biogenesis protein MshI
LGVSAYHRVRMILVRDRMLGLSGKHNSDIQLACSLGETSYTLTSLKDKQILFSERHDFPDKPADFIASSFAHDIERLNLIGKKCQIVLIPGMYELLLLDALDVPEAEMAKALRWKLKGLVDLPLNDIAVDAFFVPAHGVVGQRKKVFVAVTVLSKLKKKLEMFEKAYIEVNEVSIAELALCNILNLLPSSSAPQIVLTLEEGLCQLHIFLKSQLFLVRQLPITQAIIKENGPRAQQIALEIQRSIDYCLSELKLPEPEQIIFSPCFFSAHELMDFLKTELQKEIIIIDFTKYLTSPTPLSLEDQQNFFYGIGGALQYSLEKQGIEKDGSVD